MVEWSFHWERCWAYLEEDFLPDSLKAPSRSALEELRGFAQGGSLWQLDSALGKLQALQIEWDHSWWVARRRGTPWPLAEVGSPWKVTRQAGFSRVLWTCPSCQWELAWQLELAPWERLDWPGFMDCPLCENASSDAPLLVESLPNEWPR